MCGIFGIITNGRRADLIEPVTRATCALTHRGPDDEGIEFISDEPAAAFSHRRPGHQPMCDEKTGNWITYNGEVFNFQQVREKLEQRGIAFHSESDTEVVLKSVGLFGEQAIADWHGVEKSDVSQLGNKALSGILATAVFDDESFYFRTVEANRPPVR